LGQVLRQIDKAFRATLAVDGDAVGGADYGSERDTTRQGASVPVSSKVDLFETPTAQPD
jgi:hypothetical protein